MSVVADLFAYDESLRQGGVSLVAGVDEAGRGPLAGPVCAAAVILSADTLIDGLDDSKKLTDKRRDILYDKILETATAVSVVFVDEKTIDSKNILNATLDGMAQAVEELSALPDLVLIDGNQLPELSLPVQSLIKGDQISASIAAASILAKVARDRYMISLDKEYPEYGFARHKGYPTKAHYEMLDQHGPSPVHRESFLKKWRARSGR